MANKIKCQLCKNKFQQIASSHLVCRHNITSAEYKLMFPNAPLYSDSLTARISKTTKESGVHAKENNYMYRRCGIAHPLYGKTYKEIMGEEKGNIVRNIRSLALTNTNHPIHSAESIARASSTKKQRFATGEIKAWNKGLTKENNKQIATQSRKLSLLCKDGRRAGVNHPFYGRHHNESTKKLMSIRSRELQNKRILNPDYIKKYAKGLFTFPNRGEYQLATILKEVCPSEFRYNGDYRLGISFDGLIPDFWNINGQKKVIELFGDYWHSTKINKPKSAETRRVKNRYARCGVKCLVIWQSELGNKVKVKDKIRAFMNVKHNTNIITNMIFSIIKLFHKYYPRSTGYKLDFEGFKDF